MDYYRKPINKVVNDVKLKMQLGALTLKLSENNDKIDDLIGVDKNIKKDISSNSGLIDANTSNISSNLGKISTNKGNISSNLSKLNNIENNLILVDDIYNETFPISRFSVTYKDKRIFYRQLYLNFTTNGIIKINAKYNYVYDENYTLQHVYRFYNDKRQFKKIILEHDRSSRVINDKFEIQGIDSNRIDIAIYYENNTDSKKIELVGNNAIQINYIENNSKLDMNKNNISFNSGLISTNKNNISTNLIKINSNKDDILYNLNEINYIKNNNSKSYLKNIYNILFYDKKTQISFKDDIFYEKVFELKGNKNDFIEIKFKIDLQYDDISERNYVKTIYQLLDENNNNSLYIKSINNNEYSYFSNRVIVDEDIFLNFTKDIKKIKFVIKFQKLLSSRVIYLYYIKNENYRFILKYYSS